MMYEQGIVHTLYKKLLALYPQTFKEQLAESMEQTFRDLWNEKRQTKKEVFSFILWTFLETAIGICRAYLLLISPGDIMQTMLKTLGSSTLISLLLILPFMIMEVVNRRNLNEDFPFMLFFVMWLNLFTISLILLPIARGRRTADQEMANPSPTQENTVLTNPRSALILSILLFLFPGIFPLLNSLGWLSMDRLFNGPNPEVAYLPGQILSYSLILFPIAAGIIAGGPIVRTVRAGGSLFAHPINLIIVVFILSTFVIGLVGLIVDQWPCFMGVPNCD
jgi:magnesium-transporting ATPase (P-type)